MSILAMFIATAQGDGWAQSPSGFGGELTPSGLTLTSYTGSLTQFELDSQSLDLVSCFATVEGRFVGFVVGAPPIVSAAFVTHFELGLDGDLLICRRRAEPSTVVPSVFEHAQVISLYGYPGIPVMGILGAYTPAAAAEQAARWAERYDVLNGDRSTIGALHLITAVAQRYQTSDGTYLSRLSFEVIEQYVQATSERGQLLFLDLQVGWSTPIAETVHLERWLLQPHVHLAIDPEFATASKGVAPGQAIGTITGTQINGVQEYLDDLAKKHGLPRKILVVHQFREDMITAPGTITRYDLVDLVIDMDGFGPWAVKLAGYERYARSNYAQYAGFKLFFNWDTPLRTPAEIQAMDHPPDLIIYQ